VFSGVSGFESASQGNLMLPNKGQIGFYLRTTTPNLKTQIAVNDHFGVEKSVARRIVADGKWHKYAWDLADNSWKGVNSIVAQQCTLNSIYLSGSSDATVHIDSVFFNEQANGSTGSGAGLTKSGVGTLTLIGSNNYTGNTTVNTGTINVIGGVGTITPATLTGSGTFDALTVVGTTTNFISSGFWTDNGLILNGGTLSGVTSFNIGTVLLNDPSLALSQPSGIPGTVLVPEPAAIGILIATPALLHRRRKSEI
jgi:autotransporter-associated beta strand protein